MIELPQPPLLNASISAVSFEGLTVTDAAGNPAQLAIIAQDGKILDIGNNVAAAAWNCALASYRRFLIGEGHLRVHTTPPGQIDKAAVLGGALRRTK